MRCLFLSSQFGGNANSLSSKIQYDLAQKYKAGYLATPKKTDSINKEEGQLSGQWSVSVKIPQMELKYNGKHQREEKIVS